jgi:DUF4097 and DUF4098 domain-containing protein YvlB
MVKKIVYLSFITSLAWLTSANVAIAQIAAASAFTGSSIKVNQDENLLYANRVEMAIGKKLIIKNIKGNISINGNNNSRELQINVWQEKDISLLDRGQSAEAGVRVWTQDDELNIETISSSYNNRSKFSAAYRLELSIPKGLQIYVDNQLGNVTINDVSGTLAVAVSQGNITIENSVGDTNSRVKTFNGDIYVSNYGGHLMALCSLGDLTLSNVNANLRAKTKQGDIDGTKLSGTIIFKVTSGDIDIEINDNVKLINLTSIGGNIDVRVNTGQLFDLELAGSEIDLDDRNRFIGSRNTRKVSGKIGSGGTPLIMSATGDCNLTIRD